MTSYNKSKMKQIQEFLSKNYTWKYEYKTSFVMDKKKDIHIHFTPQVKSITNLLKFLNKLDCRIIDIWNFDYYGISLKVRT